MKRTNRARIRYQNAILLKPREDPSSSKANFSPFPFFPLFIPDLVPVRLALLLGGFGSFIGFLGAENGKDEKNAGRKFAKEKSFSN